MNNPEKLARYGTQNEYKQNKNTTQYVLDTAMYDYMYRPSHRRVGDMAIVSTCLSVTDRHNFLFT